MGVEIARWALAHSVVGRRALLQHFLICRARQMALVRGSGGQGGQSGGPGASGGAGGQREVSRGGRGGRLGGAGGPWGSPGNRGFSQGWFMGLRAVF